MNKINSYKDLIVWQKSIKLVKEIYRLSKHFPKEEQFGITNQIRRAAVSVPSNIAEGYGRKTQNDRLHFFTLAYGSSLELETQLYICKELSFAAEEEFNSTQQLLEEVLKMLNKLTSSVRSSHR